MTAFRTFLAVIFTAIVVYTVPVVIDEGLFMLFGVFFGDIAKMQWPGQFNFDFLGFLLMSGCWIAWRHGFSPGGIALGIGGVFLGAPWLCAYLLIHSFRTEGDIAALLLGPERARAR